jgi:hypothetical protein
MMIIIYICCVCAVFFNTGVELSIVNYNNAVWNAANIFAVQKFKILTTETRKSPFIFTTDKDLFRRGDETARTTLSLNNFGQAEHHHDKS